MDFEFDPMKSESNLKEHGMNEKQPVTESWTSVKKTLQSKKAAELVSLIGDLYGLSKANKVFLHSRCLADIDDMAPYEKIIQKFMDPEFLGNKPYQIAKAKKAISDYYKASRNIRGQISLMLLFVECGNNFTLEYGDINAPFYDALNLMYRKAIEKVLTLGREEQSAFQEQLKDIMDAAEGIGWGYYDMLCDDYYEAFPQEMSKEEEGGEF